jgi:hypothetical protein
MSPEPQVFQDILALVESRIVVPKGRRTVAFVALAVVVVLANGSFLVATTTATASFKAGREVGGLCFGGGVSLVVVILCRRPTLVFEMDSTCISVGLGVFGFPPSVVGNPRAFPPNMPSLTAQIALCVDDGAGRMSLSEI